MHAETAGAIFCCFAGVERAQRATLRYDRCAAESFKQALCQFPGGRRHPPELVFYISVLDEICGSGRDVIAK